MKFDENNILFPMFISLYKKDNKSYIYYYRGLTVDDKFMYQAFNENDLSNNDKIIFHDGAILYTFNSVIKNITCKLKSNIEGLSDMNYTMKLF